MPHSKRLTALPNFIAAEASASQSLSEARTCLQVVFPFLQSLDLRGMEQLGPEHVSYFKRALWLQQVMLNFHSDEKLSAAIDRLKEMAAAFQVRNLQHARRLPSPQYP